MASKSPIPFPHGRVIAFFKQWGVILTNPLYKPWEDSPK